MTSNCTSNGELVKKIFDEIKELTYKINENDLIYYFKDNIARKRF